MAVLLFFRRSICLAVLPLCLWFGFFSGEARADSLRLLADFEYDETWSDATERATGVTEERNRTSFSQLYTLDFRKELSPTLNLNLGGLFDQEDTQTENSDPLVGDTEGTNTTTLPYVDLQLLTPIADANVGYRKSERENEVSTSPTTKTTVEEYSARLSWKPVELPQVDLNYNLNRVEDDPLTNRQEVENILLRSQYQYGDYDFYFSHAVNDALNQISGGRTTSQSDRGTVRFSRAYAEDQVRVGSSLRINHQQSEFSGPADRSVPVSNPGLLIGTRNDDFPTTSDPDQGFSLTEIDLLVDFTEPVEQFSFGLDFTVPTEVDALFVNFADIGNSTAADFSWDVYIRDNPTENWTQISPVQTATSLAENRFEVSFPRVETRFIKLVTTQMRVSGEELFISNVSGRVTLPPDTSEFTATDWTGDVFVNWNVNEDTTAGFELLYSEQSNQPLDDKKTLLNTGFNLAHVFNETFRGSTQLRRTEAREKGEGTRTNHDFSAALAARYLPTFDQRLTYSFSHENDQESRDSYSQGLFLRSNMVLYEGWSLFVDTNYGWQESAEGEEGTTAAIRLGSNIQPNRWLNLTLTYGVQWNRAEDQPTRQEQDGHLIVNWVPTRSLSLTADLRYNDESGEGGEATLAQRYFIGWSPLRDGTLDFSLSYGWSEDPGGEQIESVSPRVRWQINRATLMSFDYAIGERKDHIEVVEFENLRLTVRVYY